MNSHVKANYSKLSIKDVKKYLISYFLDHTWKQHDDFSFKFERFKNSKIPLHTYIIYNISFSSPSAVLTKKTDHFFDISCRTPLTETSAVSSRCVKQTCMSERKVCVMKLYTDRIHLQFTTWLLPLCCRHNVKTELILRNWGDKLLFWFDKKKRYKLKEKPFRDQRWISTFLKWR